MNYETPKLETIEIEMEYTVITTSTEEWGSGGSSDLTY